MSLPQWKDKAPVRVVGFDIGARRLGVAVIEGIEFALSTCCRILYAEVVDLETDGASEFLLARQVHQMIETRKHVLLHPSIDAYAIEKQAARFGCKGGNPRMQSIVALLTSVLMARTVEDEEYKKKRLEIASKMPVIHCQSASALHKCFAPPDSWDLQDKPQIASWKKWKKRMQAKEEASLKDILSPNVEYVDVISDSEQDDDNAEEIAANKAYDKTDQPPNSESKITKPDIVCLPFSNNDKKCLVSSNTNNNSHTSQISRRQKFVFAFDSMIPLEEAEYDCTSTRQANPKNIGTVQEKLQENNNELGMQDTSMLSSSVAEASSAAAANRNHQQNKKFNVYAIKRYLAHQSDALLKHYFESGLKKSDAKRDFSDAILNAMSVLQIGVEKFRKNAQACIRNNIRKKTDQAPGIGTPSSALAHAFVARGAFPSPVPTISVV